MLTERQREVLGLLALGKDTREIAQTLGMSPGTVQGHINQIKLRLQLKSRLELALYWNEQQRAAAA